MWVWLTNLLKRDKQVRFVMAMWKQCSGFYTHTVTVLLLPWDNKFKCWQGKDVPLWRPMIRRHWLSYLPVLKISDGLSLSFSLSLSLSCCIYGVALFFRFAVSKGESESYSKFKDTYENKRWGCVGNKYFFKRERERKRRYKMLNFSHQLRIH